ncbi:hypothetical protein WA026_022938 [Henosepilachna vigintioctopunctata]|uniref:Uncharacterized protein n=1 Tax=Henosepilachna vigintioctopunctata TaxID=420089 RepID=A0AAW1U0M9_9CUCU
MPASCNSDIGDIVSDSFEMSALQNVSAKYGEDNFGTRNATESTPASCNSDIGDIVSDSFEMSALQKVSDMNLAITKVELEKVRNSANICNNITNINEVCALFKNNILGSETKYGEDNFGTRNATESTPASCNSDIGDIVSDSFEMSALQKVSDMNLAITKVELEKVRNSANICNNITNINEVCALFKNNILGSETKYGEDNFGTRNATESTPASCNSDIGDIVSDSFEMSALQNVSDMNLTITKVELEKVRNSANICNNITNINEVCALFKNNILGSETKYGEDNFGTRDATESTPASCNSDIGDIVSDSFEMSALQNVSDMNLAITKVELEKVRNSANICNNITNISEVCTQTESIIIGTETKYGEDNFGTRDATESTPASCNSDIGDIVPDNFEMSAVQNVPGPCILIEDIHFDAKGNIVKRKMYKNDSKIDENKFSGKKKEYCIFCKSFKTHLARHFTTCHKNERRVKNFMYLPLKSLERRKKIEELRKEGQLENNSQRNPELIMSVRRSKNKGTDLKDLRICPYCKGYYRRLRAHIPLCKADAKNKRNINVLGRQCSQNLHHLASDKIKSIFSVMRPDIVFSMISQDELVIRCANRWASKYRHVKDENMIRARARLIGRFLIEFNKLSENVHNFKDVFSPQLSDRVIKSINAVAGLETSEKYAFPNVARELGTLLKKCASIYNYILIENQEREKKKDLKDFCVLLEQNLSDSINKTVMENVAELRRQKVVTLPEESDITLLKKSVTNRAAVFFDRFQSDKTLYNYTNLASFVSPLDRRSCKRLKWFCDICYESEVIKRTNDEVIKEIKQLKDQISRLEEKVSAIKVDDNDNVKYSNAGAEEIKQRSEAAIIISAKNEDINKHTSIQNDLKGAIKPQKLRIGVNNMKTTGAGKVKISCEKKTDILKLKSEIESKLGSKYDISEVKTRKPKIKIVGINENMDKDELKNTIVVNPMITVISVN